MEGQLQNAVNAVLVDHKLRLVGIGLALIEIELHIGIFSIPISESRWLQCEIFLNNCGQGSAPLPNRDAALRTIYSPSDSHRQNVARPLAGTGNRDAPGGG